MSRIALTLTLTCTVFLLHTSSLLAVSDFPTLCAGGAGNLQFPNAIAERWDGGKWCRDLKWSIVHDRDEEYPSACGYCKSAPAGSKVCNICRDGSIPTRDPNTKIPLGLGYQTFSERCGFYATKVQGYTSDDVDCDVFDLGEICGCPPPKETCLLCPDGSKMTRPNTIVPGLGEPVTCQEMFVEADQFPKDSEACHRLSLFAVAYCGCPYVKPPKHAFGKQKECHLCSDGASPPNPDYVLKEYQLLGWYGGMYDEEVYQKTCGGYDWHVRFGWPDPYDPCSAYQATTGATCGCPNPPKPACEPECPEGTTFAFMKKHLSYGNHFTHFCSDRLRELSAHYPYSDESGYYLCSDANKKKLQEECCVKTSDLPNELPGTNGGGSQAILDPDELMSESNSLGFRAAAAVPFFLTAQLLFLVIEANQLF
uniref:Uncharacterized protein n=1 Tax=Pseudictyota dubia TaxID=2749911 RepID=A0A7R9Z433_9STRA|mmetsp:Transcript_2213/g.3783  ORF Transcript_2213/g.3783 Transcript_2213/m.3783 type:complete len:424 (+) Transcript_2213:694-1965(+)|eukprot:CAMPEP_0197451802 /NCGR_PEP_ID=MMETSP1175-20131217/30177_1 /TAXON_ID=1003142 /ORGANISM="Triceratium dubium, Strain CCMP147" /LENGTH=423 /DNA_ID=CAMNT_0042984637 /DNA_START=675 /DNA_END=1946 /DNA_ORIENTATION=-